MGLEDFSDALVIQEGIDQGWIKVPNLNEEEAEISRRMAERAFEIHLGEAQAIQLARKINAVLLMDESSGRALAEAWGLRVRGTLAVILRALGEGLIDDENAKEYVLKLVNKGFRIEPRLLARILEEIDGTAPRHRG
jgi:predicted nucleic acid-binding protein